MALPTLDSVFASAADLPRRQMLAKWLVEELDSGSIADYWTLPERYLWAKIAVAAGAPRGEADYISLPKNYAWSDIYNAVSGDIANSTVVVSGLADTQYNGIYVYDGDIGGRPSYRLNEDVSIYWFENNIWNFLDFANGINAASTSNVAYPWLATGWISEGIDPTGLVLTPQTPNYTDWSEKQALGHIAAAYRGDTANPEALATYINWPWRYQVASIIVQLATPPEPTTFNAVIVSGAGTSAVNGTYTYRGEINGKGYYNLVGEPDAIDTSSISYDSGFWWIYDVNSFTNYEANEDVEFPWLVENWEIGGSMGEPPIPTLTPTNV